MRRVKLWLVVVLFALIPAGFAGAEKVSDLPAPTGYVSDFAGALSPSTKQNVEALCYRVDRRAHAQIAVVTIKTLDDDQSIEDFALQLEEKWKVGPKGTDRGVLMVLVMTPRRGRIEVGYGLEGILNDAKVGDIGRAMGQLTDYNQSVPLGVGKIAQVIADDAGVSLTAPAQQYHREPLNEPVQLTLGEVIAGAVVVMLILFFLVKTGNTGLIFFLLGNLMGGGGGGYGGSGRRGGGGDGGGFGGFGGGSSGGGGASGDF